MWFVFSRGFYVAHASRLRRPPVALGEATVFFVIFVIFVFFVVSRHVRREQFNIVRGTVAGQWPSRLV
jgi:hypothetical protein